MIFLRDVFINNLEYDIDNDKKKAIYVNTSDFEYTTDTVETELELSHNDYSYTILKDIAFLKKIKRSTVPFVDKKLFVFFGKYQSMLLKKNINFLNDHSYFIVFIIVDNVNYILKNLKDNDLPIPNIIYSLEKYPNNIIETSNIISQYISKIYNIEISKYILINFSIYININTSILSMNCYDKDKIYIQNTLNFEKSDYNSNIVYINNKN